MFTSVAFFSKDSYRADTSKPFTGEARLTSAIVLTWAESTWILLSMKEINKIRSLNMDRVQYNSGSDSMSVH